MHRRRARNQTTTFDQEGNRTYLRSNMAKLTKGGNNFTLELSKEELEVIVDVFANVGGIPTGRRKYADTIWHELQTSGVGYRLTGISGEIQLA
jgi:hypothetical protein